MKSIVIIIMLLLAVVIGVIGCDDEQDTHVIQPSDIPVDWNYYEHDDFSIWLPPTWIDTGMNGEDILEVSKQQNLDPNKIKMIQSSQWDLSELIRFIAVDTESPLDHNVTLGIAYMPSEKSLDDEFAIFKRECECSVFDYRHSIIKGHDMVLMETVNNVGNFEVQKLWAAIDYGNKTYSIVLGCLVSEVGDYRDIFNSIVCTFEVKGVV